MSSESTDAAPIKSCGFARCFPVHKATYSPKTRHRHFMLTAAAVYYHHHHQRHLMIWAIKECTSASDKAIKSMAAIAVSLSVTLPLPLSVYRFLPPLPSSSPPPPPNGALP
mgnify:CR=1 FL=1